MRKSLRLLILAVLALFIVLLLMGFGNTLLELLRSRVTVFLVIGPLFVLFLWSAYKTFGPRDRR